MVKEGQALWYANGMLSQLQVEVCFNIFVQLREITTKNL